MTARHLEDLHRQSGGNGQLTLPYRARLTPLASDWIRSRKIVLGYGEPQPAAAASSPTAAPASAGAAAPPILWWCDGPCGPAKAAVVALEREAALRALDAPADAAHLVAVLKKLAAEVGAGRSAGAVLLVQNGARATVFANRCRVLRAVLGTSLEAVEHGVRQVAVNVLILETPRTTLQQAKNLMSRFARASRTLADEVERELTELASCG